MKVPDAYIASITFALKEYDKEPPTLVESVEGHRLNGFTPYNFRVWIRKHVQPKGFLERLQQNVPGLTDNHLDTMMRKAIKDAMPDCAQRQWAVSKPLGRY